MTAALLQCLIKNHGMRFAGAVEILDRMQNWFLGGAIFGRDKLDLIDAATFGFMADRKRLSFSLDASTSFKSEPA